MNKQEQINALRFRIEQIEAKFAEQHNPNRSEIPNSSEPDYTHLLPEGYEFCQEQNAEKWVKVEVDNKYSISHQLKVGEFAMENIFFGTWKPIRKIQEQPAPGNNHQLFHIAIHEAISTEPEPYEVDWSKAPEWADVHSFDEDGTGWWFGSKMILNDWIGDMNKSGYTLPSGLDWKQSKRRRPQ